MEVALKKQSEIQQIIVNAIASERDAVLQLASDFQFDGNALRTFFSFPSVLCCCWLGDRKGILSCKKLGVGLLAVMI